MALTLVLLSNLGGAGGYRCAELGVKDPMIKGKPRKVPDALAARLIRDHGDVFELVSGEPDDPSVFDALLDGSPIDETPVIDEPAPGASKAPLPADKGLVAGSSVTLAELLSDWPEQLAQITSKGVLTAADLLDRGAGWLIREITGVGPSTAAKLIAAVDIGEE